MTVVQSTTSLDLRCSDILRMWLRWHEASLHITELMYRDRDQPEKLRDMLDELDRLRIDAASASQQLLDAPAL